MLHGMLLKSDCLQKQAPDSGLQTPDFDQSGVWSFSRMLHEMLLKSD